MSEAITQAAAYDLIDRFLRNNLYDDDYAEYSKALEAISQPAPSPQPAVPGVSDEQIRKTVESIQDPDTVPAFHNGYYTLTPDELRRAILALRPAVEPMTPEQIVAIRDRVWSDSRQNTLNRFARAIEAHHGITAKAEDAHQPTKEDEK